jgi:hypothetical protein
MKKTLFLLCAIILAFTVSAQNISLRSSNTGITKSQDSFSGFQATFSFNQIESATITSAEQGTFSALTIANTMPAGEVGTPQLPVFKKFIAIPVGATPKVVVKNHTTTEYNLNEHGIHTISPVQPDVPKNVKLEDVPFAYNTKAYTSNEYTSAAIAEVEVLGTMRGVIIGMLVVRPVQYNPVAHTIMTYNDIEVEVTFENGNYAKTQEMYRNTYSPYFEEVYKITFNRNVFDDHPDLYNTPVHMLVLAHSMFTETLEPWLEWKTKKGFYIDVEYVDGVSYTQLKTLCQTKYNQGATNGTAPTFVVVVGDVQQVPASKPGTSSDGNRASDLYYGCVNGGYFPDMYYSRMSAQTTQQLANQIEKILYYEKYQFADPSYLDNVLLIAGADGSWNPSVGQPTINYATNYYYNAAHGYANIYKYLNSYSGCYANLNNVGFANYTAHGGETGWSDPSFSVPMVANLTNVNKYFIAMGNCCLAADFGYGECLGEAMMRAPQKGAVGYIGSCPLTYWHDDLHFAVGAYQGSFGPGNPANPTLANTMEGVYDVAFHDADFNCLSSYVMTGNLNVTYAIQTPGYTGDTQPLYYWEAYNVLGDASLMPYNTQAAENNVSHIQVIYIGLPTYEVNADPGSYVAISKDGELLGVAVADENGVAVVTLEPPITSGGDVDIVVTRNQRQPYMVQVPAVAQSGSYITGTLALSADNTPYSGATISFDLTLKNVGIETATGISMNITTESNDVTLIHDAASLAVLAAGAEETMIQIFSAEIKNYLPDETPIMFNLNIISDNNDFHKTIKVTVWAPKLDLTDVVVTKATGTGAIAPGDEVNIDFKVANIGHDAIADVFSTALSFFSGFELFENEQTITQINAGESQHITFTGKVGDNVENGSMIPIHFYAFKGTYTTEATGYVIVGSVMEDFETGNFLKFNWEQGANPWIIESNASNVYQGAYSARSKPSLGDNNISQLKMTTYVPFESTVSYARKVSSESGYDFFKFYIDGNQKEQQSGTFNWATTSFTVNEGVHTFMFEYSKDQSVSSGSDCAWIDNVTIPGMGVLVEEDLPQIKVMDYTVEGRMDEIIENNAQITFDLKNIGLVNVEGIIAELSCEYPINISAENSGTNQELPFSLNIGEEKSVMFHLVCQAVKSEIEDVELVLKIKIEEMGIIAYYPIVLRFMCGALCEPPVNLEGICLQLVKNETGTVRLTWEAPENIDELLGYNVYRDGEPINEELVTETRYQDVTEVGEHTYQVSAVYEDCESELTDPVIIDVVPMGGIYDFSTASFKLFPNPANSSVTFEGVGLNSLEIYNLQGQKLADFINIKDRLQIDVSNYESGVYFVKMYSETQSFVTKRLVIVK